MNGFVRPKSLIGESRIRREIDAEDEWFRHMNENAEQYGKDLE